MTSQRGGGAETVDAAAAGEFGSSARTNARFADILRAVAHAAQCTCRESADVHNFVAIRIVVRHFAST